MRTNIFILATVLLISSCTDTNEKPIQRYNASIQNNPSSTLNVIGFNNNNNDQTFSYDINSSQIGGECKILGEYFAGYTCNADSIVFKFENGKGYACAIRITNTANLCWEEKTPFGSGRFFTTNDNINYNFIITEEDFQNAKELPN